MRNTKNKTATSSTRRPLPTERKSNWPLLICERCGVSYPVLPDRAQGANRQRFCTRSCAALTTWSAIKAEQPPLAQLRNKVRHSAPS